MRLAMVSTFYPPFHFGGDAVFLRRLVHALARRGHEVEVVHDADAWRLLARRPDPEPLPEPAGVRVHRLESRLGALSCLAVQQTGRPVVHARRLRRILDEGGFDVVHFHNASLVGGPGVFRYGPPDAVKLYMAHEHWLVCENHVLWRHGRELCTGRQCLRCSFHHRRPPQLWRRTGLLEREARHVDVFYSPSRFSAAKHRELGFPRSLEVLPYFLPDPDSGAEAPAALTDRPSRRPYFLFVGRLEKIKGLQDVIPHFGPQAPADLWVVGSGEHEAALRRQAEGHPHVHFLGARSPESLRSLYAGALAVVAPSVCYETFGIILLEAFREGTPVLARRLGPFTEIVQESGGGLLFEDDAQLAEGLRRLGGDAALRRKLGEAGRRALQQRWTERVVIRGYLEMIRRAAERKNPALARRLDEGGRIPA